MSSSHGQINQVMIEISIQSNLDYLQLHSIVNHQKVLTQSKLRSETLLALISITLLIDQSQSNMEKILKEEMDSESQKKKIRKHTNQNLIKFLYSEVFSYTYGVSNESDHPIVFKLDLSQSENLSYSTKGPQNKKLLQPREMWFMMHAQAGFGNFTKAIASEI